METNIGSNVSASKSDDNLLAAIAHVSIIFGMFLIPLIIWLLQKDKSDYVEFQAKQALVYQIVLDFIIFTLYVAAFFLSFVFIGFLLIPVVFILAIVGAIYGIYGAYQTYYGKDFRYIVIGDMLSK